MRLWGRGSRSESAAGHGRSTGSLVRAIVEDYDPDAAVALIQRDWQPQTPQEEMALAIAMGMYRDLVPHGDACIELLRASAERHGWCSGVLLALAQIGTAPAILCLQDALRTRWRAGTWDQHCSRMLSLPYGVRAMVAELHARLDPRLASLLVSLGWNPDRPADRAALCVARGDLQGAVECGPEASGPLIAAIEHVEDRYAVLEALASLGTPQASEAVVTALAQQWARGVYRWSDFETAARCGGTAIPPLLRLAVSQPMRASMVAEIIAKILERPDTIAESDLEAAAAMPNLIHQYMMEDDPRVYEQELDCSALREAARSALKARAT